MASFFVTLPSSHAIGQETSLGRHNHPELFADWWLAFSDVWVRTSEASLVATALAEVGLNACCVDVGCGDMTMFARGMIPLPQRYIGIDPSTVLLKHARRRFPDIQLHKSRGATLPLPAQSADIVLCSWVLHISNEPFEILGECQRVARPGAVLLIILPDVPSELYALASNLLKRLLPGKNPLSPEKLLREQHAIVYEALHDYELVVTPFSGDVLLPDDPTARARALYDFLRWLSPPEISTADLQDAIRRSPGAFVSLPSRLTDPGILVTAKRSNR